MIIKLLIFAFLAASPVLGSSIKGHREEAPPAKGYREQPLPVKGHREESLPIKGHREELLPVKGHREEPLPIKGHREEPLPIKGHKEEAPLAKGHRLLAPVEQQRVQVEQQRVQVEQQRVQVEQQRVQVEQQRVHVEQQQTKSIAVDKKEDLREEQQQIQLTQEPVQKIEELKQEQEPLVQKLEEAPLPVKRYEAKSQVSVVRQEQESAKGQSEQKLLVAEQTQQRSEEAPKIVQLPLETEKPIESERIEQVQRDTSSLDSQQVELHEEQRRYEAVTEQRRSEETQQVEEIHQQQVQYPTKGQHAAPLGQAEPYAFEYQVEGSSRRESGDVNGVVRGQYTLQSNDGSSRIVDYVADANGFRASVNTNEFGTEARSPAGIELRSSQPEAQDISLKLEGKTRESLQPAPLPPPPAVKVPQIPDNWRAKGQAAQPTIIAQLPQLVVAAAAAPAPIAEHPAAKGQYPLKTQEPLVVRAPAKGELDNKQQLEPQQQVELIGQAAAVEQLESIDRRAPSAEYRAPKGLVRSAPVVQSRHAFESATAHRNAPIVPEHRPVYLSAPPAIPVSAPSSHVVSGDRRPIAPVRSHLRQAPSRGHNYQADRHYPSSSLSAIPSSSYRRPAIQPSSSSSSAVASSEQQPRSYSLDDDSLTASFDRSA